MLKRAHSTTLRASGTLTGWGDETWGQLNLPGGNNWIAVAAGATHSVALRSTGSLWAEGGTGFYEQSDEPGGTVSSPIVERYSYDVYGKPTITAPNGSTRTTSNFGNRFMFTGREYDTETSNYYYRARYYSPKLGRFLQTDPIGYAGGLNLYTYCLNNPVNYKDPYGLDTYWGRRRIGGTTVVSPDTRIAHEYTVVEDESGNFTTYSYTDPSGSDKRNAQWVQDHAPDRQAAQEALRNRDRFLERAGDSRLDPHVRDAFAEREGRHEGYNFFTDNCQDKNRELLEDAQERLENQEAQEGNQESQERPENKKS